MKLFKYLQIIKVFNHRFNKYDVLRLGCQLNRITFDIESNQFDTDKLF